MQVRNRGTIGGSLAEADPSGDWATVLLTLETEVRCLEHARASAGCSLPISSRMPTPPRLAHDELVSEVVVKTPPKGSGGAYLAFKRSAPVYPTASAAVQLTMEGEICKDAAIALGCVGLTAIKATDGRGSPARAAR